MPAAVVPNPEPNAAAGFDPNSDILLAGVVVVGVWPNENPVFAEPTLKVDLF